MSDAFKAWETELVSVGNIVQDSDDSVPAEEAETRFNRYIELLEAIDGSEGVEAARAIVRSIQASDDYGAYQRAEHALWRFPDEIAIDALICELPALILRQRVWAGELLCGLANTSDDLEEQLVAEFNEQLDRTESKTQQAIKELISTEEQGGWLEHRKGVLNSR